MILMIVVSPLGKISPAAILAGAWGVVYALQSIFAPDMGSSYVATMAIFAITLAFASGEMVGCSTFISGNIFPSNFGNASFSLNDSKHKIRLKKTIIFLSILSIAGALLYADALGLFKASSFTELVILPGVVREQIFAGELDVPFLSRVGFLISYSAVILSLLYYYLYRWHWYLALPMIAVLLLGMSQSGRAGTMIIVLQVIITIYFKNIMVLKRSAIYFLIRGLFFPIFLLSVIFFGGQFLREGFDSVDGSDFSRVLHSLRGYLFGGVSAFSYWIDNIYNMNDIYLGRYSFSSLFAALGIHPQAPGVYAEYLSISDNGETSNLFTAYRSFIDDFSIAGACFFYFFSGIVTGLISKKFMSGESAYISILIPVIAWLAFSPLYSLTYFNSFLLSCFLPFYIHLKLRKKHEKN